MGHLTLQGHTALVLWTQLAVLLVGSRALGALAVRFGQPAVVGSLLAGVLLGPSVFGHLWPAGFRWFLPAQSGEPRLLFAIAAMCLMLLLIVLGAETDLPLIRSLGRAATLVSAGSLALPVAAAAAVAFFLPAAVRNPDQPLAFAVLLAGGLTVSSLPVVARIVTELRLNRRNVGQLAIASATANDAFGFLTLGLAAALARGAGLTHLLIPLAGLAGLVLLLVVVGQPLIDALLRLVRRGGPNIGGSFAVSFGAAFAVAAVAQALQIDAAFGAFLAGVALGRSRFQQWHTLSVLEAASSAFFAPLYFATAGLQVDVSSVASTPALVSLAVLLAIAVGTKYIGSLAGGLAAGLPLRDSNALGALLNGRGAMQVIIGSQGLALGVFRTATYTIVILISIVASLSVPPVVRAAVGGSAGTAAERERLEREEELEANVAVRGQRLLLPSRGNPNSFAAAEVLDTAWPEESELTVLTISEDGEPAPDVSPILSLPSGRPVRHRHLDAPDIVEEVLAEARLGYGVIALGAAETPGPEQLLPPVIEGVLNYSPIPVVVVRRPRDARSPAAPLAPRRILVPVTGSASSRAGQEVAHNISRRTGAEVVLAHVLTRPTEAEGALTAVLTEAQAVAEDHQVPARPLPLQGGSAGDALAGAAERGGTDLVVVGATLRRVAGRPFLGHTVEHLLEHVPDATVIVVALPDVSVTETAVGEADRSAR